MSKFVIQLKRDGEIDPDDSKSVEVKSFAEATFLLVEDLVTSADKDWSVEIIEDWLRQSSHWVDEKPSEVSVEKTDQECVYKFSYEV